jgi:hypothetical protein
MWAARHPGAPMSDASYIPESGFWDGAAVS